MKNLSLRRQHGEQIYHEYLGASKGGEVLARRQGEIYRFYQGLVVRLAVLRALPIHATRSLFTASFTLVIMQVKLQYFFFPSQPQRMLFGPEKRSMQGKLSQLDSWRPGGSFSVDLQAEIFVLRKPIKLYPVGWTRRGEKGWKSQAHNYLL
jgi:hypothetical protein